MYLFANARPQARAVYSSILAWIGFSLLVLAGAPADAQCVWTAFANGTTADAVAVNDKFNCLAQLTGANFSGPVNVAGNLGVGTSSPGAQLEIYGPSGTPTYSSSNSFNPSGSLFAVQGYGGNGLTVGVYGATYTYATWLQSGFQGNIVAPYGMVLNPFGGSVAIGTATPSSGYELTVAGSALASGGTWVNSDGRLKDHVATVTNGLALVEQLRPVRYEWLPVTKRTVGKDLKLATDRHQIGFIAQEVEKVVPEAVTEPAKGRDAYSMNEAALIPVLTAAVKEQQAEIELLKAQVAKLSAKPPGG